MMSRNEERDPEDFRFKLPEPSFTAPSRFEKSGKDHNMGRRFKHFFKQNTKNRHQPIEAIPTFSNLPSRSMIQGPVEIRGKPLPNERAGNNMENTQLRQDNTDNNETRHPGLAILDPPAANGSGPLTRTRANSGRYGKNHGDYSSRVNNTNTYGNPPVSPEGSLWVRDELSRRHERNPMDPESVWRRASVEMEAAHKKELEELNGLLAGCEEELNRLDAAKALLLQEVQNQNNATEVARKRWHELDVKVRARERDIKGLQSQLKFKEKHLVQLSHELYKVKEESIGAGDATAEFLQEKDDKISKLQKENWDLQETISKLARKNLSLQSRLADRDL